SKGWSESLAGQSLLPQLGLIAAWRRAGPCGEAVEGLSLLPQFSLASFSHNLTRARRWLRWRRGRCIGPVYWAAVAHVVCASEGGDQPARGQRALELGEAVVGADGARGEDVAGGGILERLVERGVEGGQGGGVGVVAVLEDLVGHDLALA